MNIIGKKYWYLIFSLIIIIPGLVSLYLYGLNLSIEFTGGSRFTFAFEKPVITNQISEVKSVFSSNHIKISTIEKSDKLIFVRTVPVDQKTDLKILSDLNKKVGNIKQAGYETVGPTIGSEITTNAIKGLTIASF